MMSDQKLFSFKRYWGRYAWFSVVSLPFSLTNVVSENSEYPNAGAAFFFAYFSGHLMYWALYVMLSFQFMMVKKSKFSFSGYMYMVIFIFGLAALLIIGGSIFAAINHSHLHPLHRTSFGLAFALAGYNLYHENLSKSSGV